MLKKLLLLTCLLSLFIAAPAGAATAPRMVAKSFFQSIIHRDSNQYCLLAQNNSYPSRMECQVDIEEWFFRSGASYAIARKQSLATLAAIPYSRVVVKRNYARVSFPGNKIDPLYLVNNKQGVWRFASTNNIPVFVG